MVIQQNFIKSWNLLLNSPRMNIRKMTTEQLLPILTLYTKENCSLCDEALEVLRPYKHRFQLEEVDIKKKENKDWFNKYRYDIPVFHFNGKFLMKHKVDLQMFEKALKEYKDTNT